MCACVCARVCVCLCVSLCVCLCASVCACVFKRDRESDSVRENETERRTVYESNGHTCLSGKREGETEIQEEGTESERGERERERCPIYV